MNCEGRSIFTFHGAGGGCNARAGDHGDHEGDGSGAARAGLTGALCGDRDGDCCGGGWSGARRRTRRRPPCRPPRPWRRGGETWARPSGGPSAHLAA